MNASLPSGLTVREWNAGDSIPAITALLHGAYAPLAAMGLSFLASHQDDETTSQRLRDGYALVAVLDGAIIATITLYPPNQEHVCEWYRQSHVFRFGQFAVSPSLQRCGIGSHLMRLVEQHACRLGAVELALDTAEGATHLRRWYEATGFRFVQFIAWHDTNYRSVVMSKSLTEVHKTHPQ